MRGRKPSPLSIDTHDRTILQEVARSETLPWYQVRRARTILAIAAGQRTAAVASRLECDAGTVWRTGRMTRSSSPEISPSMTMLLPMIVFAIVPWNF